MFTKDRGFYKTFLRLCVALMLEQAVILSVNLADNLMLGTYSQAALSGVAAVNQIQFVYQQLVYAIGNALIVLGSQYWGQRRLGEIRSIAAIGVRLEIALALILFTLVSLFPEGALRIFTDQAEYVAEGVAYLKIIRFSYLFFALTAVLLSTMRVVESVKIALRVSVLSLIINIAINYLLIGGHFGAPELGARGAAIGTLTARVVEFIVVGAFVLRDQKLGLRLRDMLKTNAQLTRDFILVSLPTLGAAFLWGIANALQTVILGHMTAAAIAANSVASTLFLLVKSIPVGAASTASIMIGKKIGEGDLDVVKNYARVLQKMFVVIGIISGILLFFLRIPVLRLYDLSENTREMANTFLIILSIVAVGMSYQMPTNNGIIRGGGNAMFVVKMDIISIWGIVIPLSLIMAFVVKASPVVVVCCLNADQIFKCVPAFLEANYGKWIRKLTRDEI